MQICSYWLLHNIFLLLYDALKTMSVEGTQVNRNHMSFKLINVYLDLYH